MHSINFLDSWYYGLHYLFHLWNYKYMHIYLHNFLFSIIGGLKVWVVKTNCYYGIPKDDISNQKSKINFYFMYSLSVRNKTLYTAKFPRKPTITLFKLDVFNISLWFSHLTKFCDFIPMLLVHFLSVSGSCALSVHTALYKSAKVPRTLCWILLGTML